MFFDSLVCNYKRTRKLCLASRYIKEWVIVDRGYRDYYYKPHYADTNGVIERFWFGASSDTAAASYKGPADSAVLTVDPATIHNGNIVRYISVKDDDGLIRGGRFVVYADSSPPIPILGAIKTNDSIRVEWFGHDKKDSCFTEFRILSKKVSTPAADPILNEAADSLTGWLPGLSAFHYVEATKGYSFTFKPDDGSGYYFFQVIARDARKTKTWSTNKPYVNY